jgi:MFS family permease
LRLDRLPWCRFHWAVVIALGVTWVLDGLEVTVVSAVASVLESPRTLALTSAQIGIAGTAYLAGSISGALLFGDLTDRFGRKRLFLVTLSLYVLATIMTALSWSFLSFATFRMLTGAAIGGEYAAINSAIDELLPARVRGHVDLAINGSYWLGTAIGALMTVVLLDPVIVPETLGWRLCFGAGAVLTMGVALVRHFVPESPRWLILHGRIDEARKVVEDVEQRVRHCEAQLPPVEGTVTLSAREQLGYLDVLRVIFGRYRERALLGLSLMISQAFFYNAIFFTYALILTRFFHVQAAHVGYSLILFAISNFMGPLLLGRLFDTVGRRPLIIGTYAISGVFLLITGWLFQAGLLTAVTQSVAWAVTFFVGSAAASSAYLTVSELFPLQIRARAIALFYAIGTAAGGLLAPALFGVLIGRGHRHEVFLGYSLGAALMLAAAAIAWRWAVAAEQRSLEHVTPP